MRVYGLSDDLQDSVQLNSKEVKKMASLKDTAQAYEPPQTLNIADLEMVSVDVEVKTEKGMNKDNEEFTYNYVEIDGNKYRVPNSVLTELKTILEENPELKKFKVKKAGSGLQTRYTVIPII